MKIGVGLLILIGCCHNAFGQESAPRLLLGAAHCLVAKQFLPPEIQQLRLGYFIDKTSDPDNTVLYVVHYTSRRRTEGYVFTLAFSPKTNPENFTINNNREFVRSARGRWGVEYREGKDPLGGLWIQEHIALAIKRIERQGTFSLRAADLRQGSSRCESYAEKRK